MSQHSSLLRAAGSAALLLPFVVACNNSSTTKGAASAGAVNLNGQITFGPLHDATVTAFAVLANGANGRQLATATSAADGTFSMSLGRFALGPTRIVVTGGHYTSEFDGADIDVGACTFSTLLSTVRPGVTKVALTPVTDIVNSLTMGKLATSTSLTAAHDAAQTQVAAFFGINGSVETIQPSTKAGDVDTEGFKYGIVLGAMDALALKLSPAGRCELAMALSQDATDGLFDGTNAGVPVPLGAGNLPSTAGTSDFLRELTDYVNNGKEIKDEGIDPTTLNGAVGEVKNGVSSSDMTPPATGISAGSSGAISTLAFDGKQWVYIAARDHGVVAIDVTDPTAASPTINVYQSLYSVNFSHNPIGGVVPLVGADHPQLFVFAYGSKHYALVDAATGAVDQEGDLPILAPFPVGFSGGSAFIAGGIPDTGRDGVWLATADGYYFFNRQTLALETLYTIDSTNYLAENLGGDVGHGLLWCPNYASNFEGAIQLIDLNANKSYYMDDTSFDTFFRSQGLSEPDAGSVDANFQIGILTNEDSPDVGFVNLATISRTDNTPPTLSTFTPSATNGATHLKLGASFSPTLSGSAVDSSTHLALMMAGFSADIAVGKLEDPAEFAAGDWTGFSDWRYNTLTSYQYARDPHAVAAFTNLSNGKSYGYLLDGRNTRALQIDLAAFLAVTPDSGGDGHRYTGDLTTTGEIINRNW